LFPKNEKGDLFPFFKTHTQLCLEPRHQTAAINNDIYLDFSGVSDQQANRGRRLGYLKGKKKGGLKTNKQNF